MPNANASLEMLASYVTPVPNPTNPTRNTARGKRERLRAEKKNALTERPKSPKRREPIRPRGYENTIQPKHRDQLSTDSETLQTPCHPQAPLLAYNLPRFNREQSARATPIPDKRSSEEEETPKPKPRRTERQQRNKKKEWCQQTPTPANKRHWYDDDPANQTDERSATAEQPQPQPEEQRNKYTKGQMPEIHDSDSMTLLCRPDGTQIQDWLDIPTGKVLACPFDTDVNYQPNHKNIANCC
ncbi:hypothetical protein EDB86DRAFT_2832168 [Lactarius hatsudake]|nr:hypothetical protein EDB86DRAFT_2832168 [Lactarius hatsudake]